MELSAFLKTGMRGEQTVLVTEQTTALALGSGRLPVFATPAMAALMEGACVAAADPALPEGFSTVGTALEIKHISATPLGMTVRASGELTAIDGRELVFQVEAFDGAGKIGEGSHRRFIVETGKFLKKVQAKSG